MNIQRQEDDCKESLHYVKPLWVSLDSTVNIINFWITTVKRKLFLNTSWHQHESQGSPSQNHTFRSSYIFPFDLIITSRLRVA